MRINSAIRAMFGITAAVGALAASLPASAATVTINDSAGSASQSVSGTTPSITVSGVTIACNISFSIVSASGITVGTAYTIPPSTVLGDVVAAGFTSGSTYCTSVKEYVGSAPASSVAGNTVLSASNPWPVQATAVTSSTTVNVTIQDFILYTAAFGYCYGNVNGTFNTSTNTLAIPSQTLTHANSSGVASGTCTINSGVSLAVSPTGLITATYP